MTLITDQYVPSPWLRGLAIVLLAYVLFCFNFFRDPLRLVPENENVILAPADGKIVRIEKVDDPEVGPNAVLVSIFLNVFNVHTNRMPCRGEIKSVDYRKGKFLAAFDHRASDENEQSDIVISTEQGIVRVKQIAGLIARRIFCYLHPGDTVGRGDRFGYIMFGSRTDIFLPEGATLFIQLGDKVIGGETILGEWS